MKLFSATDDKTTNKRPLTPSKQIISQTISVELSIDEESESKTLNPNESLMVRKFPTLFHVIFCAFCCKNNKKRICSELYLKCKM